jgi:hypothetical protein
MCVHRFHQTLQQFCLFSNSLSHRLRWKERALEVGQILNIRHRFFSAAFSEPCVEPEKEVSDRNVPSDKATEDPAKQAQPSNIRSNPVQGEQPSDAPGECIQIVSSEQLL